MDDFVPLHDRDPFRRCSARSRMYTLDGFDIQCRRPDRHAGTHGADVSPHSSDRNIVTWGDDKQENGS